MSEILDTLLPFIWFTGIAITGYIFFHRFSDVIKEKFRVNTRASSQKQKEGDTEIQIDQLIQNAPQMIKHIEEEISKQRDAGVSDDQMKGLLSKKQMLDFVVQNHEIINIIGKPIIKNVLGIIKGI